MTNKLKFLINLMFLTLVIIIIKKEIQILNPKLKNKWVLLLQIPEDFKNKNNRPQYLTIFKFKIIWDLLWINNKDSKLHLSIYLRLVSTKYFKYKKDKINIEYDLEKDLKKEITKKTSAIFGSSLKRFPI